MNSTARHASDFDPLGDEVNQCPYPYYARLRAEAPVFKVPSGEFYIASTADVVQEIFRHPDLFSNNIYGNIIQTPELKAVYMVVPTLSQSDPPQHTPLRKIVERFFTPARINAMEPAIRALADELIDDFIDRGKADFTSDFAVPLTIMVLADTLGVDRAIRQRFKLWSTTYLMVPQRVFSPEQEREAAGIIHEANGYLLELFRERRSAPRDDVISVLATAEMEDENGRHPVPEDQFVTVMQQLVSGGNETTAGTVTAGLLQLLRHPELIARLRHEPGFVDAFVEETLRFESPIQGLWRRVVSATTLAGVSLPAGAIVNIRLGSANRDDGKFQHAQEFDPARRENSQHLAFGLGVHLCVGRMLARKELKCAYAAVAARLDDLALAPGAELSYRRAFLERSLKSLPVTFRKR